MQKRLAAAVFGVGRNRIWMDPEEVQNIAAANSRLSVRKLRKDNVIMIRPEAIHSRSRVKKLHEAKRKGRHTGTGKRRGTKESRMPTKVMWMRRQRVLRRLLRKYREAGKIDKHMYHKLYNASKGNQFKNKRVLIEAVHKEKAETLKQRQILEQAEAKKARAKAQKEKLAAKAAAKK